MLHGLLLVASDDLAGCALGAAAVGDACACRSGLMPGDLEPSTSRHHLTTMKHAYLKLRCGGGGGGCVARPHAHPCIACTLHALLQEGAAC